MTVLQFQSFPGPNGVVDSIELRRNLAGLIVRDAAGVPRAGVFPRSTAALVTATASTGPMTVNVGPFEAALVRESGPLFIASSGTVAATITAAPVANSRIDVVYARQNESAAPMSDGNDDAVVVVQQGTAAASPVKPAIPDGALELATVTVPSGVTATNQGGVVVTQSGPLTATAGGTVLLRNQTDEDAWAPGSGATAYRLDLRAPMVRNGTVWDGKWIDVTPLPNSSNSPGRQPCRYRRVGNIVEIEGTVSSNASAGFVMFSLPAGYRPAAEVRIWADQGTTVQIATDGTVNSTISGVKTNLSFRGWFALV